jgi:hypothetical protein
MCAVVLVVLPVLVSDLSLQVQTEYFRLICHLLQALKYD